MNNKVKIKRKPLFTGVSWSVFTVAFFISIILHIVLIALLMKPGEEQTPIQEFAVKIISRIDPSAFRHRPSSPGTEETPIPKPDDQGTRPEPPDEDKPVEDNTPNEPMVIDYSPPPGKPEVNLNPPPPGGDDTKPIPFSPGEPGREPVPPPPDVDVAIAPHHVVVPHNGRGSSGMQKAFKLIQENRLNDAKTLIDKELMSNPQNAQALVAKGELEAGRGKLEQALTTYIKAHEADPRSTLPMDRLVVHSLLLDDPDSSLKYYELARKIEDADDFQKSSLAEVYLHRGATRKRSKDESWKYDAKNAREALNKIQNKDNALVQVTMGKLEMLEGNREEAIKHFENVVDSKEIQNGYRIDILMALSVLHTETGDKKKAIEAIDKLVALMDKWTPVIADRGLFVREFALLYKETYLGVDVNPDLTFTHERFYRKLYKEKLQRPEVEVKQTLFIISEMVDMVYDEPLEVALDEVNEYMSIAEGPKYPQCFFNKTVNQPVRYMIGYMLFGDVYYRNLKKNKAIEYYEKALEYSPGNKILLEKIKKAERL